jgi:hypothetical protein
MLCYLFSSMGGIKFSWNVPLPETHIKRQVTLLGDEDKKSEIMYSEEKIVVLGRLDS